MLGKHVAGEYKWMSFSQLSNAIAAGKEKGYLTGASTARCLSLPSTYFGSSLAGDHNACPTCTGKVSKPRRIRTKKASIAGSNAELSLVK
jgi:hypothetical protein